MATKYYSISSRVFAALASTLFSTPAIAENSETSPVAPKPETPEWIVQKIFEPIISTDGTVLRVTCDPNHIVRISMRDRENPKNSWELMMYGPQPNGTQQYINLAYKNVADSTRNILATELRIKNIWHSELQAGIVDESKFREALGRTLDAFGITTILKPERPNQDWTCKLAPNKALAKAGKLAAH